MTEFRIEVGKPNQAGEVVKTVFWRTDNYVIYKTTEQGVKWHSNDKTLRANYHKIGRQINRVRGLLDRDTEKRESVHAEIALAISQAFDGQVGEAESTLDSLYKDLLQIKELHARARYFVSAMMVAGVLILLCTLFYVAVDLTSVPSEQIRQLLLVLSCGAVGGVLSVGVGIKSVKVDVTAGAITNAIYGGVRIVLALAASVLVYFFVKAGILFTVFVHAAPHALYAIALVSGFSESVFPNLVKRVSFGGVP